MRSMKIKTMRLALVLASLALIGLSTSSWAHDDGDDDGSAARVTTVKLETFQVPEMVPNTTLDETDEVGGSRARLVRRDDSLALKLKTRDLRPAVYTFWLHLTHADGEVSILWAGNALVGRRGKLSLNTVLPAGAHNAPGYIFIGNGLQPGQAADVSVELWVRSHGALAQDADTAGEQLTRPFGGCTDSRNPNPRPGDYPCWNPQRAVF